MALTRCAPYLYEDDEQIVVDPPRTARASLRSLPGGQPRRQRITEDDEALISDLTTTRSRRQLHSVPAPQYDDGDQDRPRRCGRQTNPRYTTDKIQQQRSHAVTVFLLLAGMLIVLVLFFFGVRVYAWFMNTFHDPSYYTQKAHLDTIIVTDTQGQPNQARAFVDVQGHIDIIVIPNGDPTKARIIAGPSVAGVDDPQHAIITVSASGTVVMVTAQGPYSVNWFAASQQTYQWSYDISQKQQGG